MSKSFLPSIGDHVRITRPDAYGDEIGTVQQVLPPVSKGQPHRIAVQMGDGYVTDEIPSDLEIVADSFVVIESTPGYMPESEPADFTDYADAVAYAHELADELEEQGYECDRGWASEDNYLAIHCTRSDTVAPDLGRTIQIVRDQS